jgi:hypothetical protein
VPSTPSSGSGRAGTLAGLTRHRRQRRAWPGTYEDGNPVGLVYFCVQAKDKQPKVAKEEFGEQPHDQLLEQTLHRAFDLIEQSVSPIARGSMPERIPLTKEERRLKRAERREKQRQANIGRAGKMHLARVESEKGTAKSWIRQAGRRHFVYTVKVCELITHIKRFAGTKTLVRDFGLIADLLGPRMGCFLFQLPPSFHYTPARLKRILDTLDHTRRNVVEFRHKSW